MSTNHLWLRAKTKANLEPGLKMKVVWNTCDKEIGGGNEVYQWKLLQKYTPSKPPKVTPF